MPHIETRRGTGDWAYKIFSPDTPDTELSGVGSFKRLWDSKRKGDALRAWRDFELSDFTGWYGWLAVEDILDSVSYESEFRLWGTKMAEMFGVDPTRKRFSECIGTLYDYDETAFWDEMRNTHNFIISTGTIDWFPNYHHYNAKPYTYITLPLADDGRNVDKYLSALHIY